MYRAVTRSIAIEVEPFFLAEQSEPDEHRYVWAYRVKITNGSDNTVQLVSRRWHIIDEAGRAERVEGNGVVGKQPVLEPGESYEYTSGCPLETPSGMMRGQYTMRIKGGETFAVEIPAFSLDLPGRTPTLN
ncbi:Co2+/Mg2+ efflux protein ApaG [Pararhizobium mangrovi]|uniref:Protein ApaG n=1 Tax=Pararhizobium mangrovi TaxID=2590452 RepID=A0A506TV69_9HYPH|nr:Co2+/Mg2+ efflux protein ApaG [Pararhizobium mangrovi]TPW25963.1 Co2+/Mg2+ efflux protein ApaG [Pararhizobium mangrovi]